MSPSIRDATAEDRAVLSALAFASKAHWGYDDAFMEACRAELTVHVEDVERMCVRVACDADGAVVGFYGLDGDDVEWFFVAPAAMRGGVGAALFADAVAQARRRGAARLRIEADPFAAPFYERMGAVPAGTAPSAAIPGRALPVFTYAVTSTRA
jgi:GNAT superfamily N-acetyltransferase